MYTTKETVERLSLFLPVDRSKSRLGNTASSPARADTNTPVFPIKAEAQGYFLSFGGTLSPFVTVAFFRLAQAVEKTKFAL